MTKLKLKQILIISLVAITVGIGSYFILLPGYDIESFDEEERRNIERVALERPDDQLFGWQYPVAMFPEAGLLGNRFAYSTIRDPGGIPEGLPVRLKVPIIGVNSIIEDALITPDGRMDVPYGSENVAWFALGPKPGDVGSAVIGGHFGISNGVKFVFYDLDKLKIGDYVYIEDDKGETLTFQVRRIEMFERDGDATTVFTSDDGLAHLNLITCEGEWNRVDDTYPLRRVVFTTLVSEEEVAEFDSIFFRSLSIGDRGTDVVELQTLLVEKGLLVIPIGVSKGYFGPLTQSAVSRYQTSVGLSPTGIFDSATMAKLAPLPVVRELAFPETSIISESNLFLRSTIENIKSLYATPRDGLVTSILLTLIIFTAFYIIRIFSDRRRIYRH